MVAESSSSSTTTTAIRDLQETPTWAVAVVCLCIILLSIILERFLEYFTKWLKKHNKKPLLEAVEKIKSELMLLGFISLVLVASQQRISSFCIPIKVADTMLPCENPSVTTTGKFSLTQHFFLPRQSHRLLAATTTTTATCPEGKVPLISYEGVHQLHIFIFVLAMTHLVYSLLTMGLGRLRMRRWKAWEEETQSISYQVAHDPARFRFTRETTFARRHTGIWTRFTILLWIKCFFLQFINSVAKVDYLTLRHGFIIAHMPANSNFNFRKYIQRSLEDDFKVVIGISPFLWMVVVVLLLGDVTGVHLFLWVAYVPLAITLLVGTKLEVVLARMALQLNNQNAVVQGAPLVQPDDNLFWFSKPKWVLHLIHFTMFLNAFELAFFFWATWQFTFDSCFQDTVALAIIRVTLAVLVQIICSYITLPIYALVTQMGSQYKSAILEESMIISVRRWHERAKKKKEQQPESSDEPLIKGAKNSEFGSPLAISPLTPRHTTPPADTISSSWNETREVKAVTVGTNAASGSVIVELSTLK